MSRDSISQLLRQAVAIQSKHRCGYCLTQALWIGSQLTVDHIIPRSLGGESILENLCLACWGCNLHKQARITAVDPDTGILTRLFHPNLQNWHEHFVWQERGLLIIGRTAIGRATVDALQLNRLPLVESRQLWISAHWHPETD